MCEGRHALWKKPNLLYRWYITYTGIILPKERGQTFHQYFRASSDPSQTLQYFSCFSYTFPLVRDLLSLLSIPFSLVLLLDFPFPYLPLQFRSFLLCLSPCLSAFLPLILPLFPPPPTHSTSLLACLFPTLLPSLPLVLPAWILSSHSPFLLPSPLPFFMVSDRLLLLRACVRVNIGLYKDGASPHIPVLV